MRHIHRAVYHTLAGLILYLSAWGVTLSAQTRFALSDTTVDFTRYLSGEECLAALQRVSKRVDAANPIWKDTIYLSRTDKLDSVSSQVRNVAQACSARYRADTLPLKQYASWVSVLLAADRDLDAKSLVERHLVVIAPDSVTVRRRVLQRVYDAYMESHPLRVATMEALIIQLEQLAPADDVNNRLVAMEMQMSLADSLFDELKEKQAAERIVAFAERLTPEQRQQKDYETVGRRIVHRALDIIRKEILFDSLRKSAAAFVTLKQANWATASGRSPETFPSIVGKRATPIEADFWFTSDTTTQSSRVPTSQSSGLVRPTPGRVGLVVFLTAGCHDEASGTRPPYGRESLRSPCWGTYAVLKRLHQHFPNLEITIVSQTTGYLGSTAPLSPQEEARLQQQWWLGYHRLPATLAVTNTPFFRLPDFDNRRIDHVFENRTNYGSGNKFMSWQGRTFIVDPSGVILHEGIAEGRMERDIMRILDIVMARYNQTSAHRE